MEIKLDIGIKQLMAIIHQLPKADKILLKRTLDSELKREISKTESDLTKLLLEGPVMLDEQYMEFMSLRKDFQKWQDSLSA